LRTAATHGQARTTGSQAAQRLPVVVLAALKEVWSESRVRQPPAGVGCKQGRRRTLWSRQRLDRPTPITVQPGPGLHHVAYGVTDIDKSLAEARDAGLDLIDHEPRVGMHGTRIAFVHPKSLEGVLTEFVET